MQFQSDKERSEDTIGNRNGRRKPGRGAGSNSFAESEPKSGGEPDSKSDARWKSKTKPDAVTDSVAWGTGAQSDAIRQARVPVQALVRDWAKLDFDEKYKVTRG